MQRQHYRGHAELAQMPDTPTYRYTHKSEDAQCMPQGTAVGHHDGFFFGALILGGPRHLFVVVIIIVIVIVDARPWLCRAAWHRPRRLCCCLRLIARRLGRTVLQISIFQIISFLTYLPSLTPAVLRDSQWQVELSRSSQLGS